MSTRTSEHELRSAVLELLLPQGSWNEDEYLWLTDHTTRLFELTDAFIEPLPMPTDEHHGLSGEYWIINPLNGTIGVLTLHEGDYHEHGSFGRGERAVSALLPGFAVAVDEVFSSR